MNIPIEIFNIFKKEKRNWEDFGKLWEWAMKQEWWIRNFIIEPWKSNHIAVDMRLINPDIFADALEKFLKEKDR